VSILNFIFKKKQLDEPGTCKDCKLQCECGIRSFMYINISVLKLVHIKFNPCLTCMYL